MRVIAGRLGGRNFDSPKTQRTHPMSDKVRGALFNALGDLGGLTVLDAFAGSGACSLEAASRGATEVLAIDINPLQNPYLQPDGQYCTGGPALYRYPTGCTRAPDGACGRRGPVRTELARTRTGPRISWLRSGLKQVLRRRTACLLQEASLK